MTLDPATAAFLSDLADAGGTPFEEMASAAEARSVYRDLAKARMGDGPAPGDPCSVEEFKVDDMWYRIYRPLTRTVSDGPLPLVVFFHGGGWVVGDLATHDGMARSLASMPANVLSVDYRLAPEHPYPAAHEDAWQAVTYAASQLGGDFHSDRLVVAGDSAGGVLAASVAARCRDTADGPDVAAQCLIYPAMEPEMGGDSHRELAEGYGLTAATMRWFYDRYAPGPGFSPSELSDLSGLAPAVIATAGYDLLQDDGKGYGDRLREAGVPTTSLHFDGLIHGFFGMGGSSAAARGAIAATVAAVHGILRE